ncbi:putative lysin motif containing protein [Lyophyllum shimeji]|uniref:Lysin motif containing protein n=1 Tax=Lyophyllum shimeji TaxID=47721 RepID=A0A9P3UP01_LYOSH|nr:putative lysin motif containing protein [Lyophyllum shimeji]
MDAVAQDLRSPRRPSDAETIRRIPASQLSFFPPRAAHKSHVGPPPSQDQIPSTSANTHYPRYTSLPANSLTSLLTSLPIAASTRDTIIARLSFDSVSSSSSDRDDERNSHELDDVSQPASDNQHDFVDETDDSSLVTPKASHQSPRVRAPADASQIPLPTLRSHPHARQLSNSPPQAYIPAHPQIRTVQLEPSPAMELPPLKGSRFSNKRQAKARINLLDVEFELESTGGAV